MTSTLVSPRAGHLLRPRVDHQPTGIAYSYGPEACELSEQAGWSLDSWQADELDLILSVHEDGLWACRDYDLSVSRQQGKTKRVAAPRVLAGLLLIGEEELFWSAHEVKTVLDSHREMTFAFKRLGEVAGPNLIVLDGGDDGDIYVKVVNNNGFEGFELTRPYLPPGSLFPPVQRLRFIARSKGSGRGMSGDCNVNDEAFAINDEQTDALAPTQLARRNPQDLYFSSPPLDGRTGGVLFDLRKRARSGEDRLGFRDYGLAKTLDEIEQMTPEARKAFLDDRDNWYRALPALAAGRVPERSIEAMRKKMKDRGFAREILGCWPVQVGEAGLWEVISEDDWMALADLGSKPAGPVVFAVDANPERTHAAISAASQRVDRAGHVEIAKSRPGTSWLYDEIIRLNREHRPAAWLLDPASSAGSLLPDLLEAGIEPELVSGREFAQACGSFYESVVERKALRHRDQADLNDALAGARKRKLADAWAWDRRSSDTDISPLVAATLAWHGVSKHGRPQRSAYDAPDGDLFVV